MYSSKNLRDYFDSLWILSTNLHRHLVNLLEFILKSFPINPRKLIIVDMGLGTSSILYQFHNDILARRLRMNTISIGIDINFYILKKYKEIFGEEHSQKVINILMNNIVILDDVTAVDNVKLESNNIPPGIYNLTMFVLTNTTRFETSFKPSITMWNNGRVLHEFYPSSIRFEDDVATRVYCISFLKVLIEPDVGYYLNIPSLQHVRRIILLLDYSSLHEYLRAYGVKYVLIIRDSRMLSLWEESEMVGYKISKLNEVLESLPDFEKTYSKHGWFLYVFKEYSGLVYSLQKRGQNLHLSYTLGTSWLKVHVNTTENAAVHISYVYDRNIKVIDEVTGEQIPVILSKYSTIIIPVERGVHEYRVYSAAEYDYIYTLIYGISTLACWLILITHQINVKLNSIIPSIFSVPYNMYLCFSTNFLIPHIHFT